MSLSAKPILFNTEMVQAILDGRKKQTRRVINYGLYIDYTDTMNEHSVEFAKNYCDLDDCSKDIKETFIKYHGKYKVDDVLYVREPVKVMSPPVETCKKLTFKYLADNKTTDIYLDDNFDYSKKWIQRCQGVPNGCIKLMSRIFLKVTNVRVERLQDIDNDGFFAEGFKQYSTNILLENLNNGTLSKLNDGVKKWWVSLWNSTAKDGYKWEDNPYVFVYEFERLKNVI